MLRVLIAYKDGAALEILSLEAQAEGYEVVEATDGQEAYDAALARPPDIVFVEPELDVFDGYELCGMLRGDPDIPDDVPVVFIVTEEFDSAKFKQAKGTATLTKTHTQEQLREVLVRYTRADAFAEE